MPGDVVEWIDADGVAYDLTDAASPARVAQGMRGRFMPPTQRIVDEIPGQAGERVRAVRHVAKDVVVPVRFKDTNEAALRDTLRTWARRLNPLRGPGQLRVTGPDATPRVITCHYDSGLEIDEADGFFPAARQHVVLVFRAAEPYWSSASDTVQTFPAGDPVPFFPFFPLRLSASELFAVASVVNPGDVDAWPVWTVTGPADEVWLRLYQGDAGYRSLHLETSISAGETITIDTRPGAKTVTRSDGSNLFAELDADNRAMFSLAGPATNTVQIELAGATDDTSVLLRAAWRWLTC